MGLQEGSPALETVMEVSSAPEAIEEVPAGPDALIEASPVPKAVNKASPIPRVATETSPAPEAIEEAFAGPDALSTCRGSKEASLISGTVWEASALGGRELLPGPTGLGPPTHGRLSAIQRLAVKGRVLSGIYSSHPRSSHFRPHCGLLRQVKRALVSTLDAQLERISED